MPVEASKIDHEQEGTPTVSKEARECYIRKIQHLYGVVGELRDENALAIVRCIKLWQR